MERRLLQLIEEKYQRGNNIVTRPKIKALSFLPREPCRVLDLGCGSGKMACMIKKRGHEVIGVDISQTAINKLRQKGINGEVVDLDKNIPNFQRLFDVVYCAEVLEHLMDPRGLLKELPTIMKKESFLIGTVPNSAFLKYRISHITGRSCSEIQNKFHRQFYGYQGWKDIIEKSGFKIEDIAILEPTGWLKRFLFTFIPFKKTSFLINLLQPNIVFKAKRLEK